MMEAHVTMPTDDMPSLAVRTQRLAAWAFALALFLSVGWMALSPDDPLGAVSLLAQHGALLMGAQALLLTMVCSAVATVLAGRQLPEAGLFATALGLSALSVRGDTVRYFLVNCASEGATCERMLALRFVVETLAWSLVLFAAIPVAALVISWCGWSLEPGASAVPNVEKARTAPNGFLARLIANSAVRHVAIVAGIMLFSMAIMFSGSSRRAVLHGQSCFIVFASTFLAVWGGHRLAPVRSAMVSLLALPVAGAIAYLWAAVTAGSFSPLPNLPSSGFLRILPLQFMAVGAAAVVSAVWWLRGEGAPTAEAVVNDDEEREFKAAHEYLNVERTKRRR